jgi:hypothetical protein
MHNQKPEGNTERLVTYDSHSALSDDVCTIRVGKGFWFERLHLLVDGLRCACEDDAREPVIGHLEDSKSHITRGHLDAEHRQLLISRYSQGIDLLVELVNDVREG